MNQKEQEVVNKLYATMQDLKEENRKFRDDITHQVNTINQKTEAKHMPIYLEQDILRAAQMSINETISKVLTGYDSPLVKLIKSVVDENSAELRLIISDSFTEVIRQKDFKESIINAFSHKVAKTIISNNDGLFDKVSNELKQDAIFKAKMSIAVSNVVNECLIEREK